MSKKIKIIIWVIVIIIVLAIIIINRKSISNWWNSIKLSDSSSANPADCGGSRTDAREADDIIAGRPQCTKPTFSWNNPKVNEVCFTYDKLGVSAGENIPLRKWIRKGFFDIFPTEYFFNKQVNDKYCYVNDADIYATCLEEFPKNPKVGDKFIKCDQYYTYWGTGYGDNGWVEDIDKIFSVQ